MDESETYMKLKVMSFNIRCSNDPDGHSIEERAPRVKSILDKYVPDLVGIQEYRPAWEPFFVGGIADGYDMYYVPREFTNNKEATPVMWRSDVFECLEKKTFWLSDTPEEESRGWDEKYNVNRICSFVLLKHKKSGKVFCFMNTHFGFGDKCQTQSAELIYKYSKAFGDIPAFCTGDYNMRPTSLGYGKMTEYFTDVNSVTEKYEGCTFHGYDPDSHPQSLIDFCFINGQVTPVSFRVIKDTFDGKYPSDHYPIICELEL